MVGEDLPLLKKFYMHQIQTVYPRLLSHHQVASILPLCQQPHHLFIWLTMTPVRIYIIQFLKVIDFFNIIATLIQTARMKRMVRPELGFWWTLSLFRPHRVVNRLQHLQLVVVCYQTTQPRSCLYIRRFQPPSSRDLCRSKRSLLLLQQPTLGWQLKLIVAAGGPLLPKLNLTSMIIHCILCIHS